MSFGAEIYNDPTRDEFVIWLGDGRGGYYVYEHGARRFVPREPDQEKPPFLTLNSFEFEAIVRAAVKVLPFGDDAREALADTRLVRDRLLSLVEGFAAAPWPRINEPPVGVAVGQKP